MYSPRNLTASPSKVRTTSFFNTQFTEGVQRPGGGFNTLATSFSISGAFTVTSTPSPTHRGKAADGRAAASASSSSGDSVSMLQENQLLSFLQKTYYTTRTCSCCCANNNSIFRPLQYRAAVSGEKKETRPGGHTSAADIDAAVKAQLAKQRATSSGAEGNAAGATHEQDYAFDDPFDPRRHGIREVSLVSLYCIFVERGVNSMYKLLALPRQHLLELLEDCELTPQQWGCLVGRLPQFTHGEQQAEVLVAFVHPRAEMAMMETRDKATERVESRRIVCASCLGADVYETLLGKAKRLPLEIHEEPTFQAGALENARSGRRSTVAGQHADNRSPSMSSPQGGNIIPTSGGSSPRSASIFDTQRRGTTVMSTNVQRAFSLTPANAPQALAAAENVAEEARLAKSLRMTEKLKHQMMLDNRRNKMREQEIIALNAAGALQSLSQDRIVNFLADDVKKVFEAAAKKSDNPFKASVTSSVSPPPRPETAFENNTVSQKGLTVAGSEALPACKARAASRNPNRGARGGHMGVLERIGQVVP